MKNIEVARLLYEIANLLEIQEVPFKPQAYRRAAMSIESLSEDIEEIYKQEKLKEIPGIGEGIAKKIIEYLDTGKSTYLEELKKEFPVNVSELMKIPGLGPKKIIMLYKNLKITNMTKLKKAITEKKLENLEHFKEATINNILKGIEAVEQNKTQRILLGFAAPIAESIIQKLKKVEGIKQITIAGSYRRGKETVGDLDILATGTNSQKIVDVFTSLADIEEITAKGKSRAAIRLHNGLAVDLRVVKEDECGSALLYFTGSKEHNIELRTIALSKGFTLNEYGLFTLDKKKRIASFTEEEIYKKLNMQYIPPELRENAGEIETAIKNKIPKLVSMEDVNTDFQIQTNWSDGSDSIEEMALSAKQFGLKAIAITDHVSQMGITNPLDDKRLSQQAIEIEKLEKKLNIRIFKGAEIDIKKDGTLSISSAALKKLDFILVAVHTAWKMTEKEMTDRICNALQNYPCASLAHPTGRLIQRREPYEFNLEKVFQTAKDTNTCLEINGFPDRIDLKDSHAKLAKEMGCRFTFGSDAHNKNNFVNLNYSVITARRAWIEAKQVLNCESIKNIEKHLKGKK